MVLLFVIVSTGFRTGSTGKETFSKHPRPFSGTYQTTETLESYQFPVLQAQVTGTGTANHLGKSRLEAETTIYLEPLPVHFNGTTTFTAANGDELYTTFTGISTPNGDGTETLMRNYTVTGGTGRFSGATGSFTGISVGKTPETPGELIRIGRITLEGTISY